MLLFDYTLQKFHPLTPASGIAVKFRKNISSECHPVLVTGSKDCPKGLFFGIYWILI